MRALNTANLLSAWEQGLHQSPANRALTLLSVYNDELRPEELARLSVGQRDAELLSMREAYFGDEMNSLTACPRCSQQIEFLFKAGDVRVMEGQPIPEELRVQRGDYDITFRLPTCLDIISTVSSEPIDQARLRLLATCTSLSRRGDEEVAVADLPEEVIAAVAARMEEADPQATVEIDLNCPHCGNEWQAPFDIGSYLWTEVQAWATRLIHEIHLLASAYGWCEKEILSLSPARRSTYLKLISS